MAKGIIAALREATHYNEIITCEIMLQNKINFFLVVFYRPPSADDNFNTNFNTVLRNIKTGCPDAKLCLIGDLNLPGINWESVQGNNNIANIFCDTVSDYNLVQINKLPSRANNNNILDVALANFSDSFSDVHMIPPVFKSDHNMFEMSITLTPARRKTETRWLYNYTNANYYVLNYMLEELDLLGAVESFGDNINLVTYDNEFH